MKNAPYDIAIIGAGVIGTLIAYYASQYKLRVCVIEKNCDVGAGATKANSGIIHGGYDDKSGSVKAQFCRTGNRMYQSLAEDLNFYIQWRGSLVIGFNEADRAQLEILQRNGIKNNVRDTRILEKSELQKKDPEISQKATCALYCPSAGIVAPFEVAFTAAEQSAQYETEYKMQEKVIALHTDTKHFVVITDKASYTARFVVNVAGLFSDIIARMAGIDTPCIIPRKGEYLIYDRSVKKTINHIIFQTPTKAGKGILVTPTYANNIMIGPNAVSVENREDSSVDVARLKNIIATAAKSIPFIAEINLNRIVRAYAGLRATCSTGDFVIDTKSIPRFVSFVGIQSPGLTSAPALAMHAIRSLETQGLILRKKTALPRRQINKVAVTRKSYLSTHIAFREAQRAEGDPKRIVCRCEQVREETILHALSQTLALRSLDAVKRRTRAGMGACQGAFCAPRVRALVAREYNIAPSAVIEESARDLRSIKLALKNTICPNI